jgi:hypothetical protein
MARDLLRVSMKLDHIHCYDEGDGWGDAEPYLWTVFFKIDGDSVALTDDLKLSGTATVVTTPGSHGNLGTSDVNAGDNVPIPSPIGEWSPFLKPISVPEDLKPVVGDDLGGVVGVVTVLMEEDNVTDDGAQAGHMALNSAVQSALDDIIATLGFGHTEITDDDINAYLSTMQQAISDAVEAQQNFFENLWSFLNADDLIGSRVFYFKHDDLADSEVVDFSQRWRNEGDWELFGSVNASVACTAAAVAAANEILAKLFGNTAREMRAFREREFGHEYMPAWWSLIDRNAPQLANAIRSDQDLVESAESLFKLAGQLHDRHVAIADEHFDHAERILRRLHATGSRRARLDASRMLSLVEHLRGKTVEEAIELVASVSPSRNPHPTKDVSHLIQAEVRIPASLRGERRTGST